MTTKNKTVPVKNLRKAIKEGMGYDDAAEHSLKALRPKLNCLQESVDVNMESLLSALIERLTEGEDHSIKFEAREDRDNERLSWYIFIRGEVDTYITYYPFQMDHAESKAEEDAETLNRFILDFYGIKRHKERKPTKSEARTEARLILREIKQKQKEIKDLNAQLKKLSRIL